MRKQAGFTLIELIIVIVILGILAAYAVPKFMNIDKEARKSVTKGLLGSVRAASDMCHALAISQHRTSGANNIDTGYGNVAVNNSYATAANSGIVATINDHSDFNKSINASTITFKHGSAKNGDTCKVTYTYSGDGTTVPIITSDVSDCS